MRSKSPETTERIKSFIFEYYRDFGRSPSVREVAKAAGISVSVAQKYLVWLRDNSEIEYNGRRGISSQSTDALVDNMVPVGIIGSISCGIPQTEEEHCEDYVRLPEKLVGKGAFYLLRASGDSMVNVGIDDGDLVLIRQQRNAEPGQIVVALADNMNTLMRYLLDSEGQAYLHPENEAYPDIHPENELAIQGVAVKVLKDLEKK